MLWLFIFQNVCVSSQSCLIVSYVSCLTFTIVFHSIRMHQRWIGLTPLTTPFHSEIILVARRYLVFSVLWKSLEIICQISEFVHKQIQLCAWVYFNYIFLLSLIGLYNFYFLTSIKREFLWQQGSGGGSVVYCVKGRSAGAGGDSTGVEDEQRAAEGNSGETLL